MCGVFLLFLLAAILSAIAEITTPMVYDDSVNVSSIDGAGSVMNNTIIGIKPNIKIIKPASLRNQELGFLLITTLTTATGNIPIIRIPNSIAITDAKINFIILTPFRGSPYQYILHTSL